MEFYHYFPSVTFRIVVLTVDQPLSQAFSSLPPVVVGRKTLVAAGHVTTPNLGGKKIGWAGGVAECFDCCCGKLCGFQNLEQSPKYPLYRGLSGILPWKNVTLFLPSPKYRRLSAAEWSSNVPNPS